MSFTNEFRQNLLGFNTPVSGYLPGNKTCENETC